MCRVVVVAAICMGFVLPAWAEVARFEVARRERVGDSHYEKIAGTVHFQLDPRHPRNAVIADIAFGALGDAGRVEFSADFYLLQPVDARDANGVLLLDVPNRGAELVLQHLSRAPGRNDFVAGSDFGDGSLTKAGYTIAWVGWQFDVPQRPATVSFRAPRAQGVVGVVRTSFTSAVRTPSVTVTDLQGYDAIDPEGQDSLLTVRDAPFSAARTIPRERWQLAGHNVSLADGFEPGLFYEVSYRASNPAVAGSGLAAVRDFVSWMKHASNCPRRVQHAIGYGSSQSARFLRSFLYDGFNTDERNRAVFDGVFAFGAGASRLSVNERWALPNGNGFFTSAVFPFSDAAQRDPVTGALDGLLDNPRARLHPPKVFHVNTASEYWGMGRTAALIHTTPDGSSDVAPPANARVYFAASTQHAGGSFPPRVTQGRHPDNTLGVVSLPALLQALTEWVRNGSPPPPSRFPSLADQTLVTVEQVRFPSIPDFTVPRHVPAARDRGRSLPLLVPQVDHEGNDLAGIRSPVLAAPLATYTGWNLRNAATGDGDLVSFVGSAMPFQKTRSQREAGSDPRPSIEERYQSREHYLRLHRQACEQLVSQRFLVADQIPSLMTRAEALWDLYAPRD